MLMFRIHTIVHVCIKVIYLKLVPQDIRLTDAVEQKPSDAFLLNSPPERIWFLTSNKLKKKN